MNIHRHNHRRAVRKATNALRQYQRDLAHGEATATAAVCAYADKLALAERICAKAGR